MHAVAGIGGHCDVATGDNLTDGDVVCVCEIPVTLVVPWNRHDGAGSVAGQDIVCDPDWDPLVVHGVDSVGTQEDAGLVLREVGALQIGFSGGLLAIGFDGFSLFVISENIDQVMLGREDHEGGAEEGVWAGGEDTNRCVDAGLGGDGEIHLSADGFADPVALHGLDLLGPVQGLQIVQ